VRDHVRLRELARCLKTRPQFIEEPQIEINLLIAGAVERTGGRIGIAAKIARYEFVPAAANAA